MKIKRANKDDFNYRVFVEKINRNSIILEGF